MTDDDKDEIFYCVYLCSVPSGTKINIQIFSKDDEERRMCFLFPPLVWNPNGIPVSILLFI